MSGDVETAKSTSGPSNQDVNPTLSMLLKGLQGTYGKGAQVSPWYTQGIEGAGQDFGAIAAGDRFGTDDPGYATLRQNVMDDAIKNTNASFDASGLFGSDSNRRATGEGVANAVAGLDYGNFLNDQQRQVGAVSTLRDLLDAQNDPRWYDLDRGSSILAGTANAGGTTSSKSVPWWAALGGGISTLAGLGG